MAQNMEQYGHAVLDNDSVSLSRINVHHESLGVSDINDKVFSFLPASHSSPKSTVGLEEAVQIQRKVSTYFRRYLECGLYSGFFYYSQITKPDLMV